MIRESDVQWWVLEAKKRPESASAIIEELAKRLGELDAENERLRDEAVRSQARDSNTDNDSELSALRSRVATLQRLIDEAYAQVSLVLVSDRIQAARLGFSEMRRLATEGGPGLDPTPLVGLRRLIPARTTDDLVLLTNRGRGKVVRACEIPPVDERTIWPSAAGDASPADEWLAAATTSANPPRFRTVVTRRGFVRQYLRVSFDRALERGEHVVESPLDRDEPRVMVGGDRDDLLILTRWGKAIRFPQRSIPSQGSAAIDLEEDDEVVDALPVDGEGEVLIVTAAGYVARRDASALGTSIRAGGTGKALIRAYDALAILPFDASNRLLFITFSGRLVIEPVWEVPLIQRFGKGHLLHDLSRDPAIAVALLPSSTPTEL